jgi:polysaccharide export outer membrane protein
MPHATRILLSLTLLGALLAPAWAAAQSGSAVPGRPYRLGVGDVVQLSVWQQPDLDRELTVRDDGTIVVPLVGEVPAAGSTVPELESTLARLLRSFNRQITEVSITVTEYRSLEIFIMGAVATPGVHTFEQLPNVWDAMRAAGGPLASANLRRIRILHRSEIGTTTTLVNVASVMEGTAGTQDLPLLEPGDTMIVPDDEMLTAADRETGVQVVGDVMEPGFYPLEGPTPLMTVILMAGGFTDGADLTAVYVVHDTGRGPTESSRINVRAFLEKAQVSGNPLVYAGDTIFADFRPLSRSWARTIPAILASLTAMVALIVTLTR